MARIWERNAVESERLSRVVNMSTLCTGGSGFKNRPRDHVLLSLVVFAVFLHSQVSV
jgi:hypothetical protein